MEYVAQGSEAGGVSTLPREEVTPGSRRLPDYRGQEHPEREETACR
jgi:hypothetical protein